MAGGDNQAAVPACVPQQQSGQLGEQHEIAHNRQHEDFSASINAHNADGQSPEIGGQAEGQPPGIEGQAERQSPGTEGQAERQFPGTEGQVERQPQGDSPRHQQGSGSEDSELEAAWVAWHAFRDLLPVQRSWWMKLHFR